MSETQQIDPRVAKAMKNINKTKALDLIGSAIGVFAIIMLITHGF